MTLSTLQIGMTASRRHISGTDRYFLSLLRALPACGIGVRGVVLGDPASLDDPVDGVESFAPEGAGRLRRWAGVHSAVRRRIAQTDLVVSHGAPHAFPALPAFAGRPFVVHFHGPWALEGRAGGLGAAACAIRMAQERSVYQRARRFIVLSQAFGSILTRTYGIDEQLIRIVPGGVACARFASGETQAEARERLGLPVDRPIVFTVGRLVPTKGFEALIDALPSVRAQRAQTFLAIAGTGPLAAPLFARANALGLREHVRFLGHLSDGELASAYRAADVCVVPSAAFEGFGLVVLEALASGTPVLVTPVGGLPEAVAALDRRLVLEGTGAAALARGIGAALCGDVALPSPEACAAFARRHDWSEVASRVAAIYAEAA